MNSGKEEREAAHKAASHLAAEERCLVCHRDAPSEPAHWPTHRGMGGGKAGWDTSEWVPLCRRCHDILDMRENKPKERATIIMLINNELRRGVWPP